MWFLQAALSVDANEKPAYYHLGQKFRHTEAANPEFLMWTVLGLVGLVIIGVAAYFAFRSWSRRVIDTPDRLFIELCQSHHIKRLDRRLLVRSIRAAQLQHPGILFIDPTSWDVFAGSDDIERLLAIQKKLF